MEKPEKQRRFSKKIKQFEIYLEYVRRYSVLKLNWVAQKGYATELNNIWHDMTIKLNDCGGPVRDATHWKKVFTEWKSHTRRKLKYNKPLNKIEKELIDLTGLTSMPVRKRKSENQLKNKTSPDSNKPKLSRKESERNDVIIKDEILGDWSDTSSNSFLEEEVIDCSSDEAHSKRQKKVVQEKNDLYKKQIAVEKNQSQTDEQLKKKGQKVGGPSPKLVDVSVQVDQPTPKEAINSGLGSLSQALITLSAAINRYCDIVERRIF